MNWALVQSLPWPVLGSLSGVNVCPAVCLSRTLHTVQQHVCCISPGKVYHTTSGIYAFPASRK